MALPELYEKISIEDAIREVVTDIGWEIVGEHEFTITGLPHKELIIIAREV